MWAVEDNSVLVLDTSCSPHRQPARQPSLLLTHLLLDSSVCRLSVVCLSSVCCLSVVWRVHSTAFSSAITIQEGSHTHTANGDGSLSLSHATCLLFFFGQTKQEAVHGSSSRGRWSPLEGWDSKALPFSLPSLLSSFLPCSRRNANAIDSLFGQMGAAVESE